MQQHATLTLLCLFHRVYAVDGISIERVMWCREGGVVESAMIIPSNFAFSHHYYGTIASTFPNMDLQRYARRAWS